MQPLRLAVFVVSLTLSAEALAAGLPRAAPLPRGPALRVPTLGGLRPLLPLSSLGFGSGSLSLPMLDQGIRLAPVEGVPAVPAQRAQNEEIYRSISQDFPELVRSFDASQRLALWQAAYANDVAGLDDPRKMEKYDPTGIIGFCFGRAMAVQLMARQMGLAKEGIRKLFVIGDLRSGADPEWRFHVTTLVQGEDGQWYAIDPIMDGPLSVREWIRRVRGVWDKPGKAKFYLVPADAVIPDIRVVPEAPAKESGERLIELSFDPAGRAGFAPQEDLGSGIYRLDDENLSRHFMSAGGKTSPFDFNGITINGDLIGYNGYFTDLLLSLSGGPRRLPFSRRNGIRLAPGRAPLGLRIGRLGGHDAP